MGKNSRSFTKKGRKRTLSVKISDKKYRTLLSKRRSKKKMSIRDKKLLDDALYTKYCMCLRKLESKGKSKKKINPFAICMSSIYLKRGYKPPPNASHNCKLMFNK